MMKKSSDKWVFPFINKQLAIEHGPIEIVDLPSYIAWWIFPVRYGRVYQAWDFPLMETSRLMEPLMVEASWRSGRLVHEKSMIGAL